MSAREAIAYGVKHFHSLTLACCFQAESLLVHMLSRACPDARVFAIDTGVLLPETLETSQRFGVRLEVFDARSSDQPWTAERCCSAAEVAALKAALTNVDAWIVGIGREQAPTRAAAPKLEHDERRGISKLNPLADWSERDVWRYVFAHELPVNPLHDRGYAPIGCTSCTVAGAGREGRLAGQDKTECGIHE